MNKAQKLIKKVEEVVEHPEHTAYVHPDHVSNLEKRLKHDHVPHNKHKKTTMFNNIAYTGFGVRPEFFGGFNQCCHQCASASNSSNPVCMPGGMVAGSASAGNFSGGASAGGAGGAGGGISGGGGVGGGAAGS